MTITLDPKEPARAEGPDHNILDEESPEEELERLLLEGLNSGESVVADAAFWAERRAEVERRLQCLRSR